ncbi:MAG: hypothetical protein AAF182_00640 [Pseudomonadota bacterium]
MDIKVDFKLRHRIIERMKKDLYVSATTNAELHQYYLTALPEVLGYQLSEIFSELAQRYQKKDKKIGDPFLSDIEIEELINSIPRGETPMLIIRSPSL